MQDMYNWISLLKFKEKQSAKVWGTQGIMNYLTMEVKSKWTHQP